MYTIKTYTNTGTYKTTINPNIVKNKIRFSATINGGLGQLILTLDLLITDTSNTQGDIVKVWRNTKLIYSGIIDEIELSATSTQEISLLCTGYHSLFTRFLYNEGGNYILSKTADPGVITGAIVDLLNTKYNLFSKDITNTGTDVVYDFEYSTILETIKDLVLFGDDYYWYVDQNGKFTFKQKETVSKNRITFKKEVISLDVEYDATTVINKLHLHTKTGAYKVFEDATSISTYGLKEKYIDNQSIDSATAEDLYGNEYIAQNKDPKRTVRLTVSSEYSYNSPLTFDDLGDSTFDDLGDVTFDELVELKQISDLRPGEIIQIRNIEKDFGNLIINKMTYSEENIILELDNTENLFQLIENNG